MIANADITIYNKYIVDRAEVWKRAVIRSVVWQSQKGVASQRYQRADNSLMILIPFASGTQYVASKAWQSDPEHEDWTLQEGDVVVRGEVTDEITAATEETPAFTISSLRAKYEEVFSIMSIDAMDQGSPAVQHWELQCK